MGQAFFVPFAVLALAASPAAAAEAPEPSTPAQDAECAAWASYTGSFAEDDESNQYFAMAFSYFVGRYEAQTGQGIADALTGALNAIDDDLAAYGNYTSACTTRWDAYQARIDAWVASVSEQGEGTSSPARSEAE